MPPASNEPVIVEPATPVPDGRPEEFEELDAPGEPDLSGGLDRSGQRVSRRAVVWWALRSVAGVLLGAGLVTVVAWFTAVPRVWLTGAVVVLAVIGVLSVAVAPLLRYRVHRWQATDMAVYAVTGWLVREWRLAPLTRVQTVDTVRGPLEQLLGLATLRVTTASASGPVVVPGLDRAVAVAAAEALGEVTEQTRGDAT